MERSIEIRLITKLLQCIRIGSCLLTLLIIFLSGNNYCLSQQQNTSEQPRPRKPYNNKNEFVPEELKSPPDLPYLPPYDGEIKMSRMLSWTQSKGGPSYSMTFHAKEEPQVVMDFYKNILKQNRWLPMGNSTSDSMLSARREKSMMSVMILRPTLRGYKSQVYLTYKIYGQDKN